VKCEEESLMGCGEESLRGSPNRLEESLALVTEAVQIDRRKVWMKRNQGKFVVTKIVKWRVCVIQSRN